MSADTGEFESNSPKILKNSEISPESSAIKHHCVNKRPFLSCHMERIQPLREVRTANLQSLRSEPHRERKLSENSPITEFPSVVLHVC